MKISTKGRYALRLMLDLALNNTGEAVSLKDIARRQDISDKYLEQIISILNKAGYVRSIRGAQGGYMLRRPPKEYTVGMILRLTEGTLAPVSCVEDDAVECEREASCVTFIVWKKINDAINEVVDNITLEDLVEWYHSKSDDYVIEPDKKIAEKPLPPRRVAYAQSNPKMSPLDYLRSEYNKEKRIYDMMVMNNASKEEIKQQVLKVNAIVEKYKDIKSKSEKVSGPKLTLK